MPAILPKQNCLVVLVVKAQPVHQGIDLADKVPLGVTGIGHDKV